MLRFSRLTRLLAVVCLTSSCALPGLAQDASQGATSHQAPAAGNKLILGFRMLDWKAKHIHSPEAAVTHAETLRKLGCEVKTDEHDGHTDVQARTVYWKSLALDTQEQLQQWKSWLEQAGFDVIHGRPVSSQLTPNADGTHREVVQYRLASWKSQHIHQAAEVGQLTTLYRSLSCEVENVDHDGHSDLRYRCPQWKEIELPNHQAAHSWQDFLNKAGFETTHEH